MVRVFLIAAGVASAVLGWHFFAAPETAPAPVQVAAAPARGLDGTLNVAPEQARQSAAATTLNPLPRRCLPSHLEPLAVRRS